MSGGLNLGAIEDIAEELEKAQGSNQYLPQKSMPEEIDFRLLPPRANMGGLYFVREKAVWINQKKYISPATFGETCPMQEEIDEAIKSGDVDLLKLLKALNMNGDVNKIVANTFYIPGYVMQTDKKGNILDVPEPNPTILQCTQQLMGRINKLVTHRNYRGKDGDGEEWYITDPELGFNITCTRTQKTNRNEYDAVAGKQVEMPEDIYNEEKLPDVVTMLKKQMFTDDYLRDVIRNYLYGDKMGEETKRFDEDYFTNEEVESKEKPKMETGNKTEKKRTTRKSKKTAEKKEEPKEEAKEEETPAEEESGETRSIEDDLNDLDEKE